MAARAKNRLRRAGKRIIQLIRLRLKWHRLGMYLQDESVQSVFERLERVKGVLVHKKPKKIDIEETTEMASAKIKSSKE